MFIGRGWGQGIPLSPYISRRIFMLSENEAGSDEMPPFHLQWGEKQREDSAVGAEATENKLVGDATSGGYASSAGITVDTQW